MWVVFVYELVFNVLDPIEPVGYVPDGVAIIWLQNVSCRCVRVGLQSFERIAKNKNSIYEYKFAKTY